MDVIAVSRLNPISKEIPTAVYPNSAEPARALEGMSQLHGSYLWGRGPSWVCLVCRVFISSDFSSIYHSFRVCVCVLSALNLMYMHAYNYTCAVCIQ